MIAWSYLDKRQAARAALRDYQNMARVIDLTPDEIKAAYEDATAPRTASLNAAPTGHDPLAGENRLAAELDEIDAMRERYRQATEYMRWFEPMWQFLSNEERLILNEFYAGEKLHSGATARLREALGCSERQLHRLRADALDRLALLLFGK